VIGTNKKDSLDTVDKLLADARAGALREPPHDDIDTIVDGRAEHVVQWDGWETIDSAGERQGRPRVKIAEWSALRIAARAQREPR
jgi:hypothetical protein